MKKALLAVGALAVLGLGFFWFRAPSSVSKADGSESAKSVASESRPTRVPPPRRMAGDPSGPAAPKRFSGSGGGGEVATQDYIRNDGTAVRDHRSEPSEPNFERRPTLPKELSKVQPETLRAVRLALRPQMKECIATHASDAAENSKAQAVLTVSITDELLRVDQLEFQTTGLSAEVEEKLRACVSGVMLGHEQTVAGSVDVAKHVMTFPYDL